MLAAQDGQTQQDEPIHTLHVYTNLIQVPTLVLGPSRERIDTPIAESRFSISIDSGRWFRATHVRQEGDDPIALSILLDVTGDAAELMPKIGETIAGFAPLSLHSVDRLSIYAMDCSLLRSWYNVPADSAGLKTAVDNSLGPWTVRKQIKHAAPCKQTVKLWDAVAYIVAQLYKLPGRRVILVISDGKDKGSVHTWNEVKFFAQETGATVFGLKYLPLLVTGSNRRFLPFNREDPFQSLCELSGGMVMYSNLESLENTLGQFTTMLRERYIVEFPRPFNSTIGRHNMDVRISRANDDFVRSAGVSMPIPDPAVLSDPTTIRSDPSLAPEQGTRHPLKDPK
jgi:hypothetical protein